MRKMNSLDELTLKIYDYNFFSDQFRGLKKEHYMKIFGEHYEEVYKESHEFNSKEKTFVLTKENYPIARCIAEFNNYDLRIRDFTVLEDYRGAGIARKFIELIEEQALQHHSALLKNQEKSYDMIFLRTYIYLDKESCDTIFEMGNFLKKQNFQPYKYNPKTLSSEEIKALEAYTKLNPEYKELLKVFKKPLRKNLILKPEIKEELLILGKKHKDIVLKGLDVKLGVYKKRGFVSYKYSACPVCNDMKSALEDNSSCGKCYINKTCLEPFREGFKEDNEISYLYFSEVRKFIRSSNN